VSQYIAARKDSMLTGPQQTQFLEQARRQLLHVEEFFYNFTPRGMKPIGISRFFSTSEAGENRLSAD